MKRKSYFDLLRLSGSLAVIILHLSAQYLLRAPLLSDTWLTYAAYVSLNRWGVPVFTMLSGALLLRRAHAPASLLRRVGRLLGVWALWAIFYSAFACLRRGAVDKSWQAFWIGLFQHNHLWYLPMLAGVYILIPLLAKLAECPRLTRYFLGLWAFFGMLMPRCGELLSALLPQAMKYWSFINSSLQMHLPLGFTGYFVLGVVLAETKITPRMERWVYVLGGLATVYLFGGTILVSQHSGATSLLMYNDLSLPGALQGTAVFVLLRKRLNPRKQPQEVRRLLACLSTCSLGVYLIHPLIIDVLYLYAGITPKLLHPLLSVPLISFAVALIAYLHSWLFGWAVGQLRHPKTRSKNASA